MSLTPAQLFSLAQVTQTSQPSLTYRIDFEQNRIIGKVDGTEAMLQAVRKLLNTERYAYPIYNGDYGVELDRLIGQEYDFIAADLERTIWEALSIDDRISHIGGFTIQQSGKDSLMASFTVYTIEGIIPVELEVSI